MRTVAAIDPGYLCTRVGMYFLERDDFDPSRIVVESAEDVAGALARARALSGGTLDIVALPGGPLKSGIRGTYWLSEEIAKDASHIDAFHPRNKALAGLASLLMDDEKAIVVEPMNSAELKPEARLSGIKDYPRRGIFYAVPQLELFRRVCAARDLEIENAKVITVYLGEESCVSAHHGVTVVDTSDPVLGEGPSGLSAAGTLPATAFISEIVRGTFSSTASVEEALKTRCGLLGYRSRGRSRDGVECVAYQVAKEVGRQACALGGTVDVVALTGPGASIPELRDLICSYVEPWFPVDIVAEDLVTETLIREGVFVLCGRRFPLDYEG